jgi:hypothetical protein
MNEETQKTMLFQVNDARPPPSYLPPWSSPTLLAVSMLAPRRITSPPSACASQPGVVTGKPGVSPASLVSLQHGTSRQHVHWESDISYEWLRDK